MSFRRPEIATIITFNLEKPNDGGPPIASTTTPNPKCYANGNKAPAQTPLHKICTDAPPCKSICTNRANGSIQIAQLMSLSSLARHTSMVH